MPTPISSIVLLDRSQLLSVIILIVVMGVHSFLIFWRKQYLAYVVRSGSKRRNRFPSKIRFSHWYVIQIVVLQMPLLISLRICDEHEIRIHVIFKSQCILQKLMERFLPFTFGFLMQLAPPLLLVRQYLLIGFENRSP